MVCNFVSFPLKLPLSEERFQSGIFNSPVPVYVLMCVFLSVFLASLVGEERANLSAVVYL